MAKGKLTRIEIDLAIDKIIKKYDEYCYRFFKSPKLKAAFEDRYFLALKKGLDMQRFLAAEIDVIDQLLRKEEARLQEEPARVEQAPTRKESIADRVLRENRRKIEKYPDVRIHKDANPEVRRLLGALGELDERYMPLLADALANTNYSMNTQAMQNIESELRFLSSVGPDGICPKLTRYLALFNRFPRDYKAIDTEEKKFILSASFLLHDLQDILDQVRGGYTPLGRQAQEKLSRVLVQVTGIIDDFRLRDLKRKNF
jgi:hypothetical protein